MESYYKNRSEFTESIRAKTDIERTAAANRRLFAVEWSGQSDQEWALIHRLRDHAKRLRATANFMFFLVILIGSVGVALVFNEFFGLVLTDDDLQNVRNREAAGVAKLEAENDLKAVDDQYATLKPEIEERYRSGFGEITWRSRTGSESLSDIFETSTGDVIVRGNEGTLLVRVKGSSDWSPVTWPSRTGSESLWGSAKLGLLFGRDQGVIFETSTGDVIVRGAEGTLLVRVKGSSDWSPITWSSRTGSESLSDIFETSTGDVIVRGDQGTLLVRVKGSSDWSPITWPSRTGSESLWGNFETSTGDVIIGGSQGTLLVRVKGSSDWSPINWPSRTGSERLLELFETSTGDVIVRGAEGTLLVRVKGSSDWSPITWPSRTGSESLLELFETSTGDVIVRGAEGTLLVRVKGSSDWSPITWPSRTGSEILSDIFETSTGDVIVRGDQGTLLVRVKGSSDWSPITWPSRTGLESLSDSAKLGLLFGRDQGVIFETSTGDVIVLDDRVLLARSAAPVAFPKRSDAIAALQTRPRHVETPDWLAELRRQSELEADARSRLAVAEANIQAARAGDVSAKERTQQMIDFIVSCREATSSSSDAAMSKEMLDGCKAAYETSIEAGRKTWWELGTEKVTPVLLVVFLLAAVGAAYRYNMRMAVHYDTRANAIALWAQQRETLPEEKRSEVLSDLLGSLTADGVGFKEVKTPVDQLMAFAKVIRGNAP